MIKDIFIMSDVYVINIKEKKNSEKLINSYISIDQLNSKSFKIDEIDEISDNIKKRINSFLNDKYNFYYDFSKFKYDFWEKRFHINFEDYKISNYTCYSDNISFIELLNRCTSWSQTHIKSQKSTFFERENSYHILVVDNSRNRLAYEFYSKFAKVWNMHLIGLEAEDYKLENKIFYLEKENYSLIYFISKFFNILLLYIVISYIAYIGKIKNA